MKSEGKKKIRSQSIRGIDWYVCNIPTFKVLSEGSMIMHHPKASEELEYKVHKSDFGAAVPF